VLIIVASLHTGLYLDAVISLNGPFSEESNKLLENAQKTTEKNQVLDVLRYFNSLNVFHADFKELSQPIARQVLNPGIAEPTLEAVIQIVRKNQPTKADSHFDPYSNQPNSYRLLLAKIALMTHNKKLFESLLKNTLPSFQKNVPFLILYEAQSQDLVTAQEFIKIAAKSQAASINNTDEMGFTTLAIAAVTKASPGLTKTVLKLKPNINSVMKNFFPGKSYSVNPAYDYPPIQEMQYMTVLDLVNNALARETNPKKEQNLTTVKAILTDAGAETNRYMESES